MNFLQKMKLKGLKKKLEKFNRLREEGDNKAAQREMDIHLELAKFYSMHRFDKAVMHAAEMAEESYRAAALMGNTDAQYMIGDLLMKKANFWYELDHSLYKNPSYAMYYNLYYKEALQFIQQAENQGHALAKRLHGLAYMKGWGIMQNLEKGAQLIIESIKEEGTWDKANKIFEELGLHSPEIFSALMAQSKKTS